MKSLVRISAILLVTGVTASARADDWGTLKGRFIMEGAPPAPENIEINKDIQYCGMPPAPSDERYVIGPKGEAKNVVIWVRTKGVKVHPDYDKLKSEKAVIDNSHCRFDPHIIVCRPGQPLEIKNSDPVSHNTNCNLANNDPFNVVVAADAAADRSLGSPETVPAPVKCNIHPWMAGFLVAPPTPYVAVSDKDGKFEMKNLPVGTELEFQVWHEGKANVQKASINGKDAGWSRGRFKMTIKPGDNDLGDIKVSL